MGLTDRAKVITLEEHMATADFCTATGAFADGGPMADLRGKLLDIGAGRIAAMDEAGVDVQVLSLAAIGLDKLHGSDETAVLRGVHDELAAAVKAHPDRLQAFATPGLAEPDEAIKELERCVRELEFVGAMFDGTTQGKFLDAPEFFPVLEAAQELDVPVYLHPAPPPEPVFDAYYAGLPGETGRLLSIAGWGWHSETAIHTLRLIVSGVFDRLPRLKLIIGHMGEGIPFALARSSAVLSGAAKLERSVAETFKQQVWVTTSGYFTKPPFDCCREVIGFDRMMYSVDYPFSPMTRGRDFLESLQLVEAEALSLRSGVAAGLLKL